MARFFRNNLSAKQDYSAGFRYGKGADAIFDFYSPDKSISRWMVGAPIPPRFMGETFIG
jgi:hypothetical protein